MLSHVGTLTNMFTPKAEQHAVSSDARTCAGRLKQTCENEHITLKHPE